MELLVVIVILAILATVGFVQYSGVGSRAGNSEKLTEVKAIAAALESNYNQADGTYPALQASMFADNKIPTPPEGGSYNVSYSAGNTGYRVCANLSGSGSCSSSSATCSCSDSAQGQYIASAATPTPTPTATPVSTPMPTTAYFRVGKGFVDNVPRQITRANNDKLYFFAGHAENSNILRVHYTTAAGFPTSVANFVTTQTQTEASNILSVDTAYDGANIIHVFINMQNGTIIDHPYDITTNTFKAIKTISTGNPVVTGAYIGTSGVSSMIDSAGKIHMAYWAPSNQIMYRAYTYNTGTDTLTLTDGPTRLDSSGNANHPEVVVSPVNQSVTVAWVNGTSGSGTMSARSRPSGGAWGSIEAVSSSPVWTSANSGINIDQGPVMAITSDGVKHLVYIENYDGTGDYGRLHYVRNSGSGWTDTAVPGFWTHAPGIMVNTAGDIYAIGHGHPSNSACLSMLDLCTVKRNSNGTWGTPTLYAAHPGSDSLDVSISVKWSAVGWNAPEVMEVLFFSANAGSYQNTDVWYGRFVP